MNNIDEFVPKQLVLYLDGKSLELKIVDPNNNELNELKELDKKGLVKFRIIDASEVFIAHKGILQKMINDLSGQNPFSKINVWLKKTALSPEQFKKKIIEEDLMLECHKRLKK